MSRAEDEAFRAEARAFLAAHLTRREPGDRVSVLGAGSADDAVEQGRVFLALLAKDGWSVPTWPAEYGGRNATVAQAGILSQELSRYQTPDLYPFAVGTALVGPTLLTHGSDAQKRRWLPKIATGEEIWCQLFSEPDAGSDLAALSTRAERDGDEWRVSGQKVWSSRAHYADWGLLLARTDPAVPKHAGITAFGLPMNGPGVDVRPLRQMNGDDHFNHVFLEVAVARDEHRIGDVGGGWGVAITTLMHERAGLGATGGGPSRGQLLELVRRHGGGADPVVRQRAADVFIKMEVARLTGLRARAAAQQGRTPGPEGSGGKLRFTAVLKSLAELSIDLQGPAGVAGTRADDEWQVLFLTAPSISIRGGTDEIQRNILAERVLGLPAEPRVDKNVPFADVPRSVQVDRSQGSFKSM